MAQKQMEKIEITQSQNGYVVNPVVDRNGYTTLSQVFVFQSFENLVDWLGETIKHTDD